MRGLLTSRAAEQVRAGAFWTAVLLVVPNCGFEGSGPDPTSNFDYGATPHGDVIFCDIERPSGRHCSTAAERARGIRLSEAAVALAEGRSSDVALDDSPAALASCSGQPVAISYQGPFPQGFAVCLNCSAIGTMSQPNVTAACQKRCLDFFGTVDAEGDLLPDIPPHPDTVTFCDGVSGPSTNTPNALCFVNDACADGRVLDAFRDPRRLAESVIWRDLIGVTTSGTQSNNLSRSAPFTGNFDAGAVSEQWVTRGDAYVEFSASQPNQSHLIGFTEIPATCPFPCTDTDANFTTIDFTLGLGDDGRIRLWDQGTDIVGPDINGTFGVYAAGQRFRVHLRDNGDGTATVTARRVDGTCVPGSPCAQTTLHTFVRRAQYPVRVDTSLFELGATFTDVRIVRIR